jgi:hypothetical protein
MLTQAGWRSNGPIGLLPGNSGFPPPKPLVERLGEDFFRAFPSGPGVYLMCGNTEGALYVRKERNLPQLVG